jgi:WD40 repeat protein
MLPAPLPTEADRLCAVVLLLQAVMVHQLSKKATQNPFRRSRGRVVRVLFHPSKPLFFVATQNHVRVYNLAKQQLVKKLVGGSGVISCMAVHPSGDHVITGARGHRLQWLPVASRLAGEGGGSPKQVMQLVGVLACKIGHRGLVWWPCIGS